MRRTVILMAVLFAALPLRGNAAETVTIRPARDNAMLLNPGKGWVQYYGTDKYTKDYISVGYTRWAWSVLEPKEGQFNWKEIDDFIQQFKHYGKKSAFGVMNVSTGLGQYVTPKWVFDAGAVPLAVPDNSSPTGQQIIPKNWDDPVFLQKMKAFVQALGKHYDGNPDIAFLDIRSYGNWGEGHTGMLERPRNHPHAAGEPEEQLLSALLQGLSPYPTHHPLGSDVYNSVYDWAVAQGAGMRRDGILSKWSKDGSECLRAHGRHPSVFEYCDGYAEMKKKRLVEAGDAEKHVFPRRKTKLHAMGPANLRGEPRLLPEPGQLCRLSFRA